MMSVFGRSLLAAPLKRLLKSNARFGSRFAGCTSKATILPCLVIATSSPLSNMASIFGNAVRSSLTVTLFK